MFSNVISPNIISANLFSNAISPNEKDWSKFDKENFILDYFSINWDQKLHYQIG